MLLLPCVCVCLQAGIDRVDRTLGYMAALAAEVAADRPHGDDGSP